PGGGVLGVLPQPDGGEVALGEPGLARRDVVVDGGGPFGQLDLDLPRVRSAASPGDLHGDPFAVPGHGDDLADDVGLPVAAPLALRVAADLPPGGGVLRALPQPDGGEEALGGPGTARRDVMVGERGAVADLDLDLPRARREAPAARLQGDRLAVAG